MGGRFLTDLVVRVVDDHGTRPTLQTVAPLHYHSERVGTVIVPAGFVFDGASIPQIAMSITGWPGLRAACVHDQLIAWEREGFTSISRETADEVFAEALDACGVDAGTAHLMHSAVCAYTQSLRQAAAGDDPYRATA